MFLLGGFVIPSLLILPFFLRAIDQSTDNQFLIPGSKEITIEKPGRYYLWNDYRTIFEGKSFNQSEGIPDGLEIAVTSKTGKNLTFSSAGITTLHGKGTDKCSIGYIEVNEPCELIVSVTGDSEERVFSFAQSIFPGKFVMFFSATAASLLIGIIGFGIVVWGIIKIVISRKKEHASVFPA